MKTKVSLEQVQMTSNKHILDLQVSKEEMLVNTHLDL
jgi:hypothetical protein